MNFLMDLKNIGVFDMDLILLRDSLQKFCGTEGRKFASRQTIGFKALRNSTLSAALRSS